MTAQLDDEPQIFNRVNEFVAPNTDNPLLGEILDELLYDITTKKPNVVANAQRQIQALILKERKAEAKFIKWYMEDALSIHKTPTRVVARLSAGLTLTEKRIAQLDHQINLIEEK